MGFITIRSNAKQFAQQLEHDWKHVSELEMRGVMSKVVNTLRDKARQNAIAVGLSRKGPAISKSGSRYVRHGLTPSQVFSYVMPNRPSQVVGRATVDTKDFKKFKGAVFTEYGGRYNAPKPWFRPAISAFEEGMGKAQKRFDEAIGRMLK